MKTIITQSLERTQEVAKEVLQSLVDTNVLTLYGNLGSGKTTFAQGIGRAVGLTQKMISPTFVIVRSYDIHYKTFKKLYHIDLYRIDNPDEVIDLGVVDFMKDKENLLIIEWAEKMGEYVPEERVDIMFEYAGKEERKIGIEFLNPKNT